MPRFGICQALSSGEKQGSAAWKQTVEILGAAYYFEGRWQDADPLLEKAVGWRPEDSELLYTLAMTYLHTGRGDQARITFSKIFQVDPASPQAFALTAELMLQENRFKDAEVLTRIFNLMYELQTIQRPSASLLIGARAR